MAGAEAHIRFLFNKVLLTYYGYGGYQCGMMPLCCKVGLALQHSMQIIMLITMPS